MKAKRSATFGKTREITELGNRLTTELWLDTLAMEFHTRDEANIQTAEYNQSRDHTLSWLCHHCDREHRLTSSWVRTVTALQQVLTMGIAMSVALTPTENVEALDAMRVEDNLDTVTTGCSEADSALSRIFNQTPKGNA